MTEILIQQRVTRDYINQNRKERKMKRTEKGRTVNYHIIVGALNRKDFFAEYETIRFEGKSIDEVVDGLVAELKENLKLEFEE